MLQNLPGATGFARTKYQGAEMKQILREVLFFWKNEEFIRSKEMRRKYFLAVFTLIALVYTFYLFFINVYLLLTSPTEFTLLLIFIDLLYSALLLGMFRLSNTKYSTLCAYILLISITLTITFLFPQTRFTDLLLLYVFPVLAASFVIREWASFPFALFSIACYLIGYFLGGAGLLNHLFFGAILMIAAVSWYVATRLEYAMLAIYHSEKKYQTLVDQNPLCVYEIEGGRTGKWSFVNSKISELSGYSPQEWLAQPNLWLDSVSAKDRESVLSSALSNTHSGITYCEEYSIKRKDGHTIWVSDTYSITSAPGMPVSVQGVLVNITRRKRIEIAQAAIYRISQAAYAVNTPEELYPLIHNALRDMMPADNFYISLYDSKTDLLQFPYFVDEVDQSPVTHKPGRGLTEYVIRKGQPLFAPPEIFNQLVEEGEVESIGAPSVDWLGVPLKVRDRTIGAMALQSYTEGVRFDTDDLEMLTFVSTQVAMVIERKRAEVALHNSENIYHSTIDSLDEFIHMVDADYRVVMANQSFRRFNHQNGVEEPLEGRDIKEIVPFLFDQTPLRDYEKIFKTGERIILIDSRIVGGQMLITEVRMVPIIENGKVERIITLTRDITLQKQAEEQIKSALREKEVLLREIHHRVKNNLQVMSSLISLETDYITDPQAQRLFMETQSRVRTMALIHEELYQSKNLARVNFADYIYKLTNNLMQIFALQHNIGLKVNVDEVFLGVDTAIPCGLIVNELMTNALKYAFPNNRPGNISVSLICAEQPGQMPRYELCVEDDGVGLPPGFDISASNTLGLQLVSILIAQLRGELAIQSENGTQFKLTFSELNANPAAASEKLGEM